MDTCFDTVRMSRKVAIVDKYPVVREGLIARLALEPDLTFSGVADDIPSAIRMVAETSPCVVVVDVCLKNGDGLDLIKRLRSRGCTAKFLVWSVHDDSLYAERGGIL